ncbi:unnamed protein product [Prorocentrum cordatum]|uniref:Uncharacterized protein n=1 Tax=Prorocentrum cordatum TaxID=2364126 RepID=A0ABN9P649_9DINO|nr:unnamed protein product [Polarella glacialis]
MRVGSDPRAGAEAPAAVSFRLAWDSPQEWGGVQDDVQLRLESRASGQVQLIRIRVDGSGGLDALPPEFQAPGRFGWAALLAAAALLWCCCRCASWGSRRAPADRRRPGAAVGTRWGAGVGRWLRGDRRAAPGGGRARAEAPLRRLALPPRGRRLSRRTGALPSPSGRPPTASSSSSSPSPSSASFFLRRLRSPPRFRGR